MIKRFLLTASAACALSGCISNAGLSAHYYDECEEYYDALGIFHRECDKQFYHFEDEQSAPKE